MYNVWENALAEIEQKISSSLFATYFQGTSILSSEDGHIIIGTKNVFVNRQLLKYFDIIKAALENNNIKVETIDFKVETKNTQKIHPREVSITPDEIKEKSTKLKTKLTDGKTTKETKNLLSNGLNSKYTMETFIIGSNNDVAAAAAQSIIDNPGTRCNPFFLYGGPGLGKTHLVQAIGNALLKKNPDFRILYTPMSSFYTDFIDAVRNGKGKEFSEKFQALDCLIIDDFQQVIGKEKSQEEFFNIFNHLHQLNKQIIITSDRLPNQIESVDARLASRLTWGGAFDIQLPKFEDKCAILRSKAELIGAEIEDEAIEYIAENIDTNIRDLESEFSTILLMSEVRGLTPLELIKNGSVSVSRTSRTHATSSKQILDKVAKYYNITVKEICGKSRVANIKTARQIAMFLLSNELSLSTTKIATEVGVKDHTTVMHGIKKISQDIKLDFALRSQIDEIKEKIYG